LVVDADRVLPLPIAGQRLKAVAWRRPQVAEIARGVEVAQLPARHFDQVCRKALRTFAVKTASVVLSRKLLITIIMYRYMIQTSSGYSAASLANPC
jgi:hypothetical protein